MILQRGATRAYLWTDWGTTGDPARTGSAGAKGQELRDDVAASPLREVPAQAYLPIGPGPPTTPGPRRFAST